MKYAKEVSMDQKKLVKNLYLLTASGFFCALLGFAVYLFKPGYRLAEYNQLIYQDAESAVMSVSRNDTEMALDVPSFDHISGYYEQEFDLRLSAKEGFRIYYTTDSSVPTELSNRYTEPIKIKDISEEGNVWRPLTNYADSEPVDKASVIRAVAYDPNGNRSNVVTATFFVDSDGKDCSVQLPTVSLVSDPVNLFDETLGIYTNYLMEQWEREADFAYYNVDGGLEFNQTIGVRLRGSSTRSGPQKDFTLLARTKYSGYDYISYLLFETPVDSLILRHRPDAQNEGFLSALVSDRDLMTQEYQMVNLYIDSEFWGIYSLLSRIDEYYIANKHGLDLDNVWYLKINYFPEGDEQALRDYSEMVDFVTNADMSIKENYEKACERIDIQSMIDCYVTNIYLNDIDSNCFKTNSLAWRTQKVTGDGVEDGKWRFGLYDLDHATSTNDFDLIESIQSKDIAYAYEFNYFIEEFPFWARGPLEDPVLYSFMANPEFRRQFYDSFLEIATTNFDPERVLSLLEEQPYREGNDKLAEFFINRPKYIFDYLDDYMLHYDAYYQAKAAECKETATRHAIALPFDSVAATIALVAFVLFSVVLVVLYVKQNSPVRCVKGRRR